MLQVWQSRLQRVEIGIGNCLLRLQEFELAMQAFERVDVAGFQKGALLSGCARVALLQGTSTVKERHVASVSHTAVVLQAILLQPKNISMKQIVMLTKHRRV